MLLGQESSKISFKSWNRWYALHVLKQLRLQKILRGSRNPPGLIRCSIARENSHAVRLWMMRITVSQVLNDRNDSSGPDDVEIPSMVFLKSMYGIAERRGKMLWKEP